MLLIYNSGSLLIMIHLSAKADSAAMYICSHWPQASQVVFLLSCWIFGYGMAIWLFNATCCCIALSGSHTRLNNMGGKVCILLAKLLAVLLSKYAQNTTHRACLVIAGLSDCGLLNSENEIQMRIQIQRIPNLQFFWCTFQLIGQWDLWEQQC